ARPQHEDPERARRRAKPDVRPARLRRQPVEQPGQRHEPAKARCNVGRDEGRTDPCPAAARAGDLARAETALGEALTLYPDVPGSYIRLARVQAAAGRSEAALANVATYASMGLRLDISRDPALKGLSDLPGWAEVAATFEKNGSPSGDADEIASVIGHPEFIGEGLAHDGKGWLLSTVSGRTIVRLADGGATTPFLKGDADTGAIFGMAVDRQRGLLWAAEAWGDGVPEGTGASKTGLLKVSLVDGRVLARVFLPDDGGAHQFGDVLADPDGTVYATDSAGGGLWRLRAGEVQLEQVVAPGQYASPQGMAFCAEGKALLVADYSTGLHRVDLATGVTTPLGGLRAGMAGTDGLLAVPEVDFGLRSASPLPLGVIVTQNGVSPQRIMLLRISPDCDKVEGAHLIAANLPGMEDVSLATKHDGYVVFVGRARWEARGQDGKLTRPDPGPIRVFQASVPGMTF
ncbi:MAG TPA: hypothetical protein PLO65_15335, partial [Caulobacter sp.]|nr:hypothetical protein [Caulobacter sp.]